MGKDPDSQSAEPALLFHDYNPPAGQAAASVAGSGSGSGSSASASTASADAASTGPSPARWYHRYQHFWTHLVLSFYGPSVVYNPFPVLTLKHGDNIPAAVSEGPYMKAERPISYALRIFYVLRCGIAPWLIAGVPLVPALFAVNTVCGICLTFLFVLSHNFEGVDRDPSHPKNTNPQECSPPASDDEDAVQQGDAQLRQRGKGKGGKNGKNGAVHDEAVEPVCWYKSQVETSCTYGGSTAMFMSGGLNFQIEHHCFPRLSSWYYPHVQSAVRDTCEKHGVNYVYYPSAWSNCKSMLKYMRKVGAIEVLKHAREEF